MPKYPVFIFAFVASLQLITACQEQSANKSTSLASQQTAQQATKTITTNSYSGKVIETMDAGSYTYVKVDTGEQTIWAAGPTTAIKLGDVLSISKHMPMSNFHSKALNRDFDVIYFVPSLGSNAVASDKKNQAKVAKNQPLEVEIKKLENGNSIEEIYQNKQTLTGQTLRVRGVVVKYTPNILGVDWVHLRDNSSQRDLTVTTKDKVTMGDVVVAEGALHLNRDFGYGYVYDVIMEEVKLTIE